MTSISSNNGEIDPLMAITNNDDATSSSNPSKNTTVKKNLPPSAAVLVATGGDDDQGSDASDGKQKTRRLFAWGSLRFRLPSKQRLEAFVTPGRRLDAWCGLIHTGVESFVYVLGPVLILVASAIISMLVYTYFTILRKMLHLHYADTWYGFYVVETHSCAVLVLLVNVVVNYALCVMTSNIKGKSYNKVMREMATATGFNFPETPAEVESYRKDYEDRMILRMQCRRQRAIDAANRQTNAMNALADNNNNNDANNSSSNSGNITQRKHAAALNNTNGQADPPQPMRPWMMMGPLEWGFCNRTRQPKPPRSHYCHVSRGLVFCLDHYCPWMFNSVGYFNYRYFVNFLVFACVSMLYGASLTYAPFAMLSTSKYREQLRMNKHHKAVSMNQDLLPRMEPFLPYPHEKMYITLTFMLCLAVGLAVAMLCFFHIYLTLTSQTTIEFHGNYINRRRAKKLGKKWKNPYDLGRLRNFQQVYGSSYHPLLAILIPSAREPEFLPIPLPGEQGKRSTFASAKPTDGRNRGKGDFIV